MTISCVRAAILTLAALLVTNIFARSQAPACPGCYTASTQAVPSLNGGTNSLGQSIAIVCIDPGWAVDLSAISNCTTSTDTSSAATADPQGTTSPTIWQAVQDATDAWNAAKDSSQNRPPVSFAFAGSNCTGADIRITRTTHPSGTAGVGGCAEYMGPSYNSSYNQDFEDVSVSDCTALSAQKDATATIEHELGHFLGLPDQASGSCAASDMMGPYANGSMCIPFTYGIQSQDIDDALAYWGGGSNGCSATLTKNTLPVADGGGGGSDGSDATGWVYSGGGYTAIDLSAVLAMLASGETQFVTTSSIVPGTYNILDSNFDPTGQTITISSDSGGGGGGGGCDPNCEYWVDPCCYPCD